MIDAAIGSGVFLSSLIGVLIISCAERAEGPENCSIKLRRHGNDREAGSMHWMIPVLGEPKHGSHCVNRLEGKCYDNREDSNH